MKKVFLKNFNNNKELYLEKIVLKYDGMPMVFICSDSNKNLYLCITIANWDYYECIIFDISTELLKKVIENHIDILNTARYAHKVYLYRREAENYSIKEINYIELVKKSLILDNLFVVSDDKESVLEFINSLIYEDLLLKFYNCVLLNSYYEYNIFTNYRFDSIVSFEKKKNNVDYCQTLNNKWYNPKDNQLTERTLGCFCEKEVVC